MGAVDPSAGCKEVRPTEKKELESQSGGEPGNWKGKAGGGHAGRSGGSSPSSPAAVAGGSKNSANPSPCGFSGQCRWYPWFLRSVPLLEKYQSHGKAPATAAAAAAAAKTCTSKKRPNCKLSVPSTCEVQQVGMGWCSLSTPVVISNSKTFCFFLNCELATCPISKVVSPHQNHTKTSELVVKLELGLIRTTF